MDKIFSPCPCLIYHWHDSNTRTCYHVWKVWEWTLQSRWDQQSKMKSGCFYISTWPGVGGHDQRGGEERSDIFQGHAWHNLPSSPPPSPPPPPPPSPLLLLLHLFSSSPFLPTSFSSPIRSPYPPIFLLFRISHLFSFTQTSMYLLYAWFQI